MVTITENDCKQILANYYTDERKYKFKGFSLRPISDEVNGFMSNHLLLKINVENGLKGELRFFAKTLLVEQDAIVAFAKDGKMFNKEISCYKFLQDIKNQFPDFDTSFVPRYYYSRGDEFIIFEDLTESGYKMWDGPLNLDLEHLKLSLDAIARFHAASFLFEEVKSKKLGRQYSLIEDYGESFNEALYYNKEEYLGFQYLRSSLRGVCALVDVVPKKTLSASDFKNKLKDLFAQAFEDVKPSQQFRNVWCNGDLWTKNVMFKYENGIPVSSKIFDFQLQRYNPPAHDVLFMIYQTTSKEIRQEYFDYLLEYYYESLRVELEKFGYEVENILSKDEFDLSIKAVFPLIKLTKAIYKSLSAISKESYKEITNDPQLYAYVTFNDRSEFILKEFEKTKDYRDLMTALLEDLEDLFTHQKITIEECQKIVRNKLETFKYDLIDYQIVPFNERCGFLGDHSNLKVKIKLDNKIRNLSFFVKSIPKEKGQKNFVVSSSLFYKEMKFFMDIIPKMISNSITCVQDCVPKCYLALLNDVLVFDDYTLKGYITLSSRISYNYETVLLIINRLAKLSASSLIVEEKLSDLTGTTYRLGDYYEKELVEGFYRDTKACMDAMEATIKGTLTQIDLFPDPNSRMNQELFKKRATKTIYRMIENVKPSKKYRNTICHGDLWSNNILIKYENNLPIDCIFVDFQTTRYNPPAHDLMGFLYLSTDRQFRSKYMKEILNYYHSEISKVFNQFGIDTNKVLPYEEFMMSCEDLKEYAIIQCVEHFQNIILSSEQMEELFSDQEYAKKILFEDRSPFIKKICEADPVYKEKMRECITDLREICENADFLD
ncbi:hypothetical protein ILUMI_26318 [Ignelater luminosus]|uniref:CHK kinase-like domain-containing protein n=1 Tax=Ignelater luminosus TaxID=2038154 RepID=A0A8K0C6W9_IGNLU|nr:hypothetical protein ILUMI_26318 [Ignelater luminosus]